MKQYIKSIAIKKDVLLLLNKAKEKALRQNPTLARITDENTIRIALQNYIEVVTSQKKTTKKQ